MESIRGEGRILSHQMQAGNCRLGAPPANSEFDKRQPMRLPYNSKRARRTRSTYVMTCLNADRNDSISECLPIVNLM
jgi:hypothetical protein